MLIEKIGLSWENLITIYQSFYDNLKQFVGKDILSLYENNQKLAITLGTSVCALVTYLVMKKKNDGLKDLPGPPTIPFFGNFLDFRGKVKHLQYEEFGKKHGKIYKIRLFNIDVVIAGSLEAVQEMLVEKSIDFSGRPDIFRLKVKIAASKKYIYIC